MIIACVLSILLAFLFIVLQKTSIRILHQEITTVRFDFTLFSITFISSKTNKNSLKASIRILRNLKYLLKISHYGIKHANVTVFELSSTTDTSLPSPKLSPFFITSGILLVYLNNIAKSFRFSNSVDRRCQNKLSFDVLFETSLINLIIISILYLYYKVKNRIRRIV